MYGAIEAGGTKFVCAVSDQKFNIIETLIIPTTTPEETFEKVFELFDRYSLKSIGIGSFGPIEVNKKSEKYGYITSTPKEAWANVDFLGQFKRRYQIPIGWTTDVNAAVLAEYKLGAAQGKESCLYITVGTGIGGGAVINGQLLEAFNHPEMGHFYPKRHPNDQYSGICKYHGDCLEGLASGPAIEERYGMSAKKLNKNHEAWELEAFYLAQAALNYSMILRPDCIIMGGGVMSQDHLFAKIHKQFKKIMDNYLDLPPIEDYIIPTALGDQSGIIGALLLAEEAFKK